MLRLSGAILVIFGSAWLGMQTTRGYAERVRVLNALICAAELMQTELSLRLTPLPELMTLLTRSSRGAVGNFFRRVREGCGQLGERSFSEIWRTALEQSPEMGLRRSERELIEELGSVLGRYDAQTQVRHLEYTRTRLESMLHLAEREKAERGRVAGVLSLAAGAALVIILI